MPDYVYKKMKKHLRNRITPQPEDGQNPVQSVSSQLTYSSPPKNFKMITYPKETKAKSYIQKIEEAKNAKKNHNSSVVSSQSNSKASSPMRINSLKMRQS